MPTVNDRTPYLDLPKPHKDNLLEDDVSRVRGAFDAIDTAYHDQQVAIGTKADAAATTAALAGKADLVAGKVPASQLPAFVDDVLEYANFAALPAVGETGKIYVTLSDNKTYRWGGSFYVEISASPGSTDAVPEGASNRYFTDTRARAAQLPATSSALGVVKVGAGLNVDVGGTISVAISTQTFTAYRVNPTAGQTSFTVPGGYVPGRVMLLANGVMLYPSEDYTATDGTTINLVLAAAGTEELLLLSFATFTVPDAAQRTEIVGLSAMPVQVITTDTTAVAGRHYIIAANCTLTLPAAPGVNDRVQFTNLSGLTTPQVDPLTKKIRGTAGVMRLNDTKASAVVQFSGDTYGWI